MKVKHMKKRFSIENKAHKSLRENTAPACETIASWDEMLRLLDQGWEVVEELDDDRFLMKNNLLKQTGAARANSWNLRK